MQQTAMTAAGPTGAAPARFAALDGMRFTAAMVVLVFHFTARSNQTWGTEVEKVFPTISPWTAYGSLGVEFFFIISGFVILMTAWDRSLTSFAASRIARLFPAYWVGVALSTLLLVFLWPTERPSTLGQALVNLTMVHEGVGVDELEGVYWTLWVELRFYLLIGVFMLIGITRNRLLAFCAFWPLLSALAAGSEFTFASLLLLPHGYAPLFAGGMMLFFIAREGHSLLPWLIVGMNVLLGANAADRTAVNRIDGITATVHDPVVVWVIVIVLFALVAAATLSPLRHVGWRWLTLLGALTYPLYLTHEFWGRYVIHLLVDHLPGHLVLAIATAFSLVLAYVVHRFVERPLAPRLRRSVQRTLQQPHDVETASTASPAETRAALPALDAPRDVPAARTPLAVDGATAPRSATRDASAACACSPDTLTSAVQWPREGERRPVPVADRRLPV